MTDKCKDILLNREGTSQSLRFLKALDPDNLQLHDYSTQDWVIFAYSFAKHINFFDVSNDKIPLGNWEELFNFAQLNTNLPFRGTPEYKEIQTKIEDLINDIKKEQSLNLHLTLFICFLELIALIKDRFNGLTKRHLDFYYKRVLQIDKELPIPDKAHIIFELAKKIENHKIEAGTALNAGKDASGKNLVFETKQELIANKAKVASLKSLYNDTELHEIKVAQVANSFDGIGGDFPDENKFWYPFGYTTKAQKEFPALEAAQVGYSIASPMLSLAEGERNISITINFADSVSLDTFSVEDLIKNIELYYSGEKEWKGPIELSKSLLFQTAEDTTVPKTTGINTKSINLVFQLDRDMDSLGNYDSKVLDGNYNTTHPIVKVCHKTVSASESEIKTAYKIFRNLIHRPLKEIKIEVSVIDIKGVALENDIGLLKPDKPFYPFTTQPLKQSNFYINYPEMFSKKWKNVSIEMLWKDTPDSFVDHYFAYRKEEKARNSPSLYYTSIFGNQTVQKLKTENQGKDGKDITSADTEAPLYTVVEDPENLLVPTEDHFKVELSILNKENWIKQIDEVLLFGKTKTTPHSTNIEFANKINEPKPVEEYDIDKTGPIRITLKQSFLHQQFPRIYALALANEDPDTLIPNNPYTPFAESIKLAYCATETTDFTDDSELAYLKNRIQLFHNTPFGQYEEHSYLKKKSVEEEITSNTDGALIPWLVTDYCHGGEFYIGIEDANAPQIISLLFQILEGSEHPDADSFVGKQKVAWSVLCNNHWKDIGDDIITNDIDNFLRSGIVSFSIPKQATTNNTRMPSGLLWLKAKIHKDFDAVCQVIDVVAQAVLSEFTDNKNDLSHIEDGLAAKTIAKLVTRVPHVKSISQPFNSFGGKPEEEDELFYRRVSERLRHKNRAITIWDYEHLILQQFPEIFKVMCLKHTNKDSFLSPGDVSLVVIPDIINTNVFDIHKPRVSKATLNKIETHVNALNSMHVNATAVNPKYEEVLVSLNVKFHKGYDENYYRDQLILDITKFLSPWAYDTTKNIVFGIELHTSVLIDFLEDLEYIDFLENVKLSKDRGIPRNSVSPSNPIAILVSAKEHLVNPITNKCKNESIEPIEECLY